MGVPDVEQAKKRLQDILRRAQKLEIPTQEVISTRTARKLLARTRNVLAWTIWIGVFVVLLSGVVYARWPTRQDVETVRTVLRRTVQILARNMFPFGIEPRTVHMLGGCDNHNTTKTFYILQATT
ncbi:uncharacterized protein LOC105837217 isoform X1 [Monomorium pharaonis]|uniref:uncharacterized protein LOC105837217 isoform X1 n=1 Tax=Monomorium pharaonis TaxID=307658 RepID=UPI00063EE467|nr:uncharacterized protein LOC105837217 isoform X1 [Monomorium pharaonis]